MVLAELRYKIFQKEKYKEKILVTSKSNSQRNKEDK